MMDNTFRKKDLYLCHPGEDSAHPLSVAYTNVHPTTL